MISGDSTASHMGSVKNIEKARERRTFETMPGSSSAGVPDDLLAHAETVHPRMGYDMSDSIFMQEQQAAGKTKEAQRAQEEKSALEAFRAATLHAPTSPMDAAVLLAGSSSGGMSSGSNGLDPGSDEKKRKSDRPPAPIAGIRLKKKSSSSSGNRISVGRGTEHGLGAKSLEGRRGSAQCLAVEGDMEETSGGSVQGETQKKHKSKKHRSKRPRTNSTDRSGNNAGGKVDTEFVRHEVGKGGAVAGKATGTKGQDKTATGALGLVAYSSGEDSDLDTRGT